MAVDVFHRLAVTFFILAALISVTDAKFTCDTGQFKADVVQCYQNQGLRNDAIFSNFKASTDQDVTTLLASLLSSKGPEICNNTSTRQSYKSAVRCVYQQIRDCHTKLTKNMVANPDDAAKMLEPLCDNRQDINFPCVTSKSLRLQECERERLDEFTSPVNYLYSGRCHVTSIGAYCIKKEYKPCGCATSKTYSDVVYDLLQPSDCVDQNSTDVRVMCDGNNRQAFVSDGLNISHTIIPTFWVYTFALVAFRLCSFFS